MASVNTIADKRVVAEDGVVFNQYVGPLNWEHYKIPASGLSNSQLTFANFVTLGTNRIYDSNFQIEYTIRIDCSNMTNPPATPTDFRQWMRFHPFPLHWVTDQLRVNINGAACMVRPQESLPQRMMYWRQNVLDKTCSFCPHTKAPFVMDPPLIVDTSADDQQAFWNFQMKYGRNGSQNAGTFVPAIAYSYDAGTHVGTFTFREPILCPPFNQRLDEVYQGPLFNITSIDLVYQMNDLRRMMVSTFETTVSDAGAGPVYATTAGKTLLPSSALITITDANICFNVASMPTGMVVPPKLTLPYYDNVCYVTQGDVPAGTSGERVFTSGVYTLAQVPTAIYVFVSENQYFRSGGQSFPAPGPAGGMGDIDYDMSLCPIRNINITLGNNTQLLNTTSEYDRYQMAIANGLEDVTWEEFHHAIQLPPYVTASPFDWIQGQRGNKCILRLIPGVDLLIPEKRLVGGTDAEQLVFQVRLSAEVSATPSFMQPYLSLWVMFEYCGTLTIEPVHAAIDMIPLKTVPPIGPINGVTDTTVDNAKGGGEGTNPTGAGIFRTIVNAIKTGWNSPMVKMGRKIVSGLLGSDDPREEVRGVMRGAAEGVAQGLAPMMKGGRMLGGTIIGGGKLGKYYK